MIDINLLPVKNELTLIEKARRKLWLTVFGVVSIVFVVLMAAVLGIWLGLENQIAALASEKAKLVESLGQYQETAQALTIIKNKVAVISNLQQTQFDFAREITDMQQVFGSSGNFQTLFLDRNGGVTIQLTITDTNKLASLLADLVNPPDSEMLTLTKVTGIKLSSSGNLPVTISSKYIKKTEVAP